MLAECQNPGCEISKPFGLGALIDKLRHFGDTREDALPGTRARNTLVVYYGLT